MTWATDWLSTFLFYTGFEEKSSGNCTSDTLEAKNVSGTNVGQAWDNVPTEYKNIRVEEYKSIDKEVNVPYTSIPTAL